MVTDFSDVTLSCRDVLSLYGVGHIPEAEEMLKSKLLKNSQQSEVNYHLGALMLGSGRVDASLTFFLAALELDPKQAQYWLSYIHALIQTSQYDDAKLVLVYGRDVGLSGPKFECLEKILDERLNRSSCENKASIPIDLIENELIHLFSERRYEEVELRVSQLLEKYPDWLVGWKILSDTLIVQKKDAKFAASKALALNVDDAKEHCYYGLLLKNQGDFAAAVASFEYAIKLNPSYAAAYNNLGVVIKDMGDVEVGVQHYRKALSINPSYASCFSNLLFCLSHSSCVNSEQLFSEHVRFGQQYEVALKPTWPKHLNQRDVKRCLRIGFVSADFRDHSLTYFIEPILKSLKAYSNLSLCAYSASAIEDEVTLRLRSNFTFWNKVDCLSDAELAEKIQADSIDILVDLDGHTAGNRLLVFAMKPAPIQVSWLGYLATTGLTAVDYYLGDRYLLPSGRLDNQFTEKLVRLPAYAAFTPFSEAPEINELPALKNGYITFACFNRINKITLNTIKLWAKLLHAIPNAKFLLGGLPKDGSYGCILDWFETSGVEKHRLIFYERSNMESYLKLHQEVDICLDTYPSNGVTTSFHALWMGVPTLCIDGDRLASRGALAVLMHVGLENFVASDESDFVLKGVCWANNIQELTKLRNSMRIRFAHSSLAQPDKIAKALESGFYKMWARYSVGLPASSFEIFSNN